MKELYVESDACIGCGACVSIDPSHFDFNDDGLSEVISQENIESDDAKNALESCPTNAIRYTEKSHECDNDECHCDSCHCDSCNCEA